MEKTQFTNLIDGLGVIAAKNKWTPYYDKKLDSFYWHQTPLSPNSNLVKISHETSVYVDAKGKIEGLFVEYFKNNLIGHNPIFKNLPVSFRKKVDDSLSTVPKEDINRVQIQLLSLMESIKADIYKDAIENQYSTAELAGLISFAANL